VSVSQVVASVLLDGQPLPVTDTRLVFDEGWSPRCASTFTVPYTPDRYAALDPRNDVRVLVGVERRWSDSLTLDDLSDQWYEPPGPPATVLRRNIAPDPRGTSLVYWRNSAGGGPFTWSQAANVPIAAPFPGGPTTCVQATLTSGSVTYLDVRTADTGTARFPVQAGARYSFSMWAAFSDAATVSTFVQFANAAGVTILTVTLAAGSKPAGQWAQYTQVNVLAPAGAVAAWFIVRNTNPAGIGARVQGTAAHVEQATALGPWFDGATPDTTDRDYAWTGAVNASPSTESTIQDPGFTLDDLSAAWGPTTTLDDLTAAWIIDWGNGARPTDVVTADLVLRERTVNHAAATISLRATSDELLAQDAHAAVSRPVESLPGRLLELLAAGHVPLGPDPDFSAGAPFGAMPAQEVEWSQSIWDAMSANAASVGLRLWVDEARVWRLGVPEPVPATFVDLAAVIDCTDQVNRDGDYADVLVWIGKGLNDEGLPITDTIVWPPVLPVGPYRTAVVEHDYGQVGAGLPMPSGEELDARLTLLQSRAQVLQLLAPADPTIRPGVGVRTGAPSLPVTSSTVSRIEWAVPADTMTLTTRSTTEGVVDDATGR
jgi:hypothetical protein